MENFQNYEFLNSPSYSFEIQYAKEIFDSMENDPFTFFCLISGIDYNNSEYQNLPWLVEKIFTDEHIIDLYLEVEKKWSAYPKIDLLSRRLSQFFLTQHHDKVVGLGINKRIRDQTPQERYTNCCIAKKLFKEEFDHLVKTETPDPGYANLPPIGKETYHKIRNEAGLDYLF